MQPVFSGPGNWATRAYDAALKAVLGGAMQKKADTYEQSKTKLLFDFIFFYLLLQLPALFFFLYQQNYPGFVLAALPYPVLAATLIFLRKGSSTCCIGAAVASTTLISAIATSFCDNIDITTHYGFMWLAAIMLSFITASRTTTAVLVTILCIYLGACSYIKIYHVTVYVFPAYTYVFRHVANPIFTALAILFLLGLLASYYHSIVHLERKKNLDRQRQHSSLLQQNLTRQFLLLKGLSRSGMAADANKELTDACFLEIEKQCETALEILNSGDLPAND